MQAALQPMVEMNAWVWRRLERVLGGLTPDEENWRPVPEANNINTIIRHLRIEAEWHLNCLEHGKAMPFDTSPELQKSIDAVPMDFEKNLKELEDFYSRFLAQLGKMSLEALQNQSAVAYPGRDAPLHLLSYHQAMHLAGHAAQISTIRNLYQKTQGKPARFFPDNPSYPK